MVLSQKEEEVNSWNRIEFELNCINSLKSSLSFRLDTTLTQSSLPVSVSLSLHIIYLVHHTIQIFLRLDIDRRMMLVAYIIMHPHIMFFFFFFRIDVMWCSFFILVQKQVQVPNWIYSWSTEQQPWSRCGCSVYHGYLWFGKDDRFIVP